MSVVIKSRKMDNVAKSFWNHLLSIGHDMHPPQLHVANEGWSVWNQGEKIPCAHTNNIYPLLEDQKTLDYWSKPHSLTPEPRIPPEAIHNVDWEICGTAMKALSLPHRRWTSKNASENCGVGSTLLD
jgi:hypothetical protein